MSGERFVSRRERWEDFGADTLVVCPRCGGRAVTRRVGESERLSCGGCGYAYDFGGSALYRGSGAHGREGVRLWLETPCCGHTLAARNAAHLDYLEGYVRAGLRERVPDPRWGWSNQSMVSRLPRWISAASNRAAVLACIERLRRRLEEG